MSDDALAARKAELRSLALAARAGMASPGAAEALAGHILAAMPSTASVVAGFWPMGDEIDIRPALHALHAASHRVLLPVTPRRGLPLSFRPWHPGCAMVAGRFGTRHPAGEHSAVPDCLLVPLLAFDSRRHRLGYGGGYYDRTLALLPQAHRLGVAYAAQQVPEVPVGPTDVPLHAIATERGLLRV
jgi:5-formyltetrahydrofolate cyclo-ligase